MFTGIIEAIGRVAASETRGGDLRLHIHSGGLDLSTTGNDEMAEQQLKWVKNKGNRALIEYQLALNEIERIKQKD